MIDREVKRIKRIFSDIDIFDVLIVMFAIIFLQSGIYRALEAPIQYIIYKATIISIAILHARITRILIYGRIDWGNNEEPFKKILAIVLYATFILAYALGS